MIIVNGLKIRSNLSFFIGNDNYMASSVSFLCSAFFNFFKVSDVPSNNQQQIITSCTYIHPYIPSNAPRVYCPELLAAGTDLSECLTSFCKNIRCNDNEIIVTD